MCVSADIRAKMGLKYILYFDIQRSLRGREREMNVIEGFCRMKKNIVEVYENSEVQNILESMSKYNVTVVGNICYFIGYGEASKALESAFAGLSLTLFMEVNVSVYNGYMCLLLYSRLLVYLPRIHQTIC